MMTLGGEPPSTFNAQRDNPGAGAVIVMVGVSRFEGPVGLYGERLLSRYLSTIAVLPGLLALGCLTVWQYWRLASRYSRRGLLLFHTCELLAAVLLALAAFRLVGDGWGYLF